MGGFGSISPHPPHAVLATKDVAGTGPGRVICHTKLCGEHFYARMPSIVDLLSLLGNEDTE
jgi:hypothetical protein